MIRPVLVLLALALTGACGTEIHRMHPALAEQADVAAANVYFIRPFTYRERGFADNPVKVEVGKLPLLELGKGEYTMVRLKPGLTTVTTRNLTMFTNKTVPVEMTRSIEIDVQVGKNYFLHIEQVNEEFRGVYYLIKPVDLRTAKGLVVDVLAIGAGRMTPINMIPE